VHYTKVIILLLAEVVLCMCVTECGSGQLLSMGYGFIEYKRPTAAQQALKVLQHTMLDGHQLELKLSNRTTVYASTLISFYLYT